MSSRQHYRLGGPIAARGDAGAGERDETGLAAQPKEPPGCVKAPLSTKSYGISLEGTVAWQCKLRVKKTWFPPCNPKRSPMPRDIEPLAPTSKRGIGLLLSSNRRERWLHHDCGIRFNRCVRRLCHRCCLSHIPPQGVMQCAERLKLHHRYLISLLDQILCLLPCDLIGLLCLRDVRHLGGHSLRNHCHFIFVFLQRIERPERDFWFGCNRAGEFPIGLAGRSSKNLLHSRRLNVHMRPCLARWLC